MKQSRLANLVVMILFVLNSFAIQPLPANAEGSIPTLTTDKSDYRPEETVQVTGSGFTPGADLQLPVIRPDGSIVHWVNSSQSFEPGWDTVTADEYGYLNYSYYLDGVTGQYEVRAYPAVWVLGEDQSGLSQAPLATVTFTDAALLTLTKSALPLTYTAAGQVINFSYLLKNTGTTVLNGPFTVTDNKVPSVTCPATATLAVGASITCTGTYAITSSDMALGYAVNTATASSSNPGAATSNTDVRIVSIPVDCRNDSDGANDEPGQKDLTQECNAPSAVNPLVISWNWDVTSMSGSNSADACALFDTNNNGLANYAICASWQNNRVMQAEYPQLYSCADTRSDRCTGSAPLIISNGSACALELAPDDPFTAGDSYPNDTKAFCSINLADVGGAAVSNLIDVCSYPSAIPNSDPSDCVVISAAKGNLEVIKNVDPDDPSTNWNISWTGPTPYSGTITGDGTTSIQAVDTGSYNISEAAGTGTDLSLYDTTWACTVDGSPSTSGSGTTITGRSVAKGSVVICTFTNTRKTGSLEIKKDVIPDNAGTNWNFAVTGPTAYSCSITGDGTCGAKTIFTGSYSITETAGSGANLSDYGTSWACTVNGVAGPSGTGISITGLTINKSDTVVCTFTNSQSPGTLTVTKKMVPSTDAGKFNLQIDGTTQAGDVGDGGTTGAVIVSAGSHSVSELAGTGTDLSNYITTIGGDCDSSGNVSVQPNQNKTCTITNTRKGTIIVEKQTDPDGAAGSFTFTGDAAGTISDNGQIVVSNLAPGTYASTESSLATDFALESISCDDGSSATPSTVDLASKMATFKLDPGETVKCTFTNKKLNPDLAVTKTADDASVTAGETIGFTIEVKNAGPGEAKGVTITDSLPGGLAWTIDTTNTTASNCSINSGTLTCGPDTIGSSGSVKVHVTAISTPASCGTLTNTATATPTNGDAATSQETSVDVLCPDLTVIKTGNGPVSAGDKASFTITVANSGAGEAKNVTLTDTLPGSLTWALDPVDPACSISATSPQVLSCSWATLASNASVSVTVSAVTTKDNCGTLSNSASVAATNEQNTSNNSSGTADIEVDCATIQIEKTTTTPTASAGDPIVYTITVSNPGLGTAKDVTITDNLPGGLTWTIYPAVTGCSISGSTLTCNFDSIASGGSKSVTITAQTTAENCGALVNTATVTTSNDGSATTPDTVITVQCPSLSVTKIPDAASVSAGDTVGYTIRVSNAGSGEAKGVAITDSLPGGLVWALDAANTTATGCSITGSALTCGPETIASGKSVQVHVIATSTPGSCGLLSNTATATPTNGAAATSPETSVSVNCPDLTMTKTPDEGTVSAGDNIGFTITVTNSGLGKAYGVSLNDTLPTNPGLDWTIDPAVSGCSITGGVLTCDVGTLNPAATFSVHLSTPTSPANCGGKVDNTAAITAANEANTTNNSAGGSITVDCPSLTVTKKADAASVNAGDVIGFTITVSNAGPGVAKSVDLVDTLPSGSGISWSLTGGTGASYCQPVNSGVLQCNFGDMAAGASYDVHVSSPTDATSCGAYNNTATVVSANQADVTGADSTTVNCASISITKTTDTPTVSAGDPIHYTIVVTNGGDGTAHGVTITDILPNNAGLDWTINPSVTGCSVTSGVLTCNLGDLAGHTSQTITLTSPTTYASCAALSNTVSVTTSNDGSATSNTVTITVSCPAISVIKTADQATISAGDQIGFVITVTNTGDGVAKNVSLSDTLQTGLGINWSIASSDQTCTYNEPNLTCTFGDLAKGESKSIHITSPTTAGSCNTYNNTATASADNQPSVSSSQASVTVQCASITITKVADDESVSSGDTIGFTIEVTNPGPGTAYGVTIDDTLPTNAGLDWSISPAVQGCAINSGVLTCDVGTLPANQGFLVHIASPTTAATCGTVNNSATVTTTNDGSGSAGDGVLVTCPDIKVTKVGSAMVSAGDTITFQIQVENIGIGTAKDVVVTDTLPTTPGLNWSVGGPDGAACSIASGVVTCTFTSLAPNVPANITLTSPTTAASCTTISNTATATASNEPSGQTNNSSTASTTVNCPDFVVNKTAANTPVNAGDTISFQIQVVNTGLGTARDVVLTDTLPTTPGLNWTVGGVDSGACTVTSGVLTCTFASLPPDVIAYITLTSPTTAASCAAIDNTATVTASNEPSGQPNNSSTASIDVQCASLTITKTSAAAAVSAGQSILFDIVVANNGAGTAHNVTVTDVLPANPGLDFEILAPATGCSTTAGLLTCSLGDLAAHASQTITLRVTTTYASCGTVTNTASVTSSNDGSATSQPATVTVNCPALTVTKTADATPVNAGGPIGFTITIQNTGAGEAFNVQLADPLPTGAGINWTIDTGVGDGGVCSIDTNTSTVTCPFGAMDPGATKTVHVTSPTTPLSCGSYANTAAVTSTYSPSVTAGATIQVNCPSLIMTKIGEPASINAGETAKFVITIQNIGAGAAYNLVLKDTVPANYDTITSTPAWDSVSYTPNLDGTTLLEASYSSLAAGGTITVTITLLPVTMVCGEIYNAAQLTASNSSGTAVSDASIAVNCPDVTVTKTAASGVVNAGDPLTFNITVTNTGAGTAKNVTLSDTMPTGGGIVWSVGGTDAASCTIANGTLTCNFGDLASGAVKAITLTSPTTKDSCLTYNNTATVAATNEYSGLEDNTSTASVEVLCPNIEITKTSSAQIVNAGDPISFTITVTNSGPGTAKNISISDILPDKPGLSWTIDSITPADIFGSCQLNLIPPQTLTCSFDQLDAGQSVAIQVSSPTTLATACVTLNNTASVTTGNDGSSQASASINVTCANISITKQPVNAVVSAGEPITYDITVTNNGQSAASAIKVSDTLPDKPGLSWTINSITPADIFGSCQLNLIPPQTLTCSFDQLDAGQSVTIRVSSPTTYATCGTVSNTARVTTSNDGEATTPASDITVNCPALEVAKTPGTQTVSAGEPLSFTITVKNTGAGTAKNVTLTDQLPLGMTWSVDNSGCSVDANDLLTCSFGDLAPGDSTSVTVTGDTIPALCGTFDNTATIKLDNGPDVKSNTVSVTVNCPDVKVTKTAANATIHFGQDAVFDIVVENTGAGKAYNVTLTDTLPGTVTWSLVQPVPGCILTGNNLSCAWSSLDTATKITIQVKATISSVDQCASLMNTVTVSASNEKAADTANNTSMATVAVTCPLDLTVSKTAEPTFKRTFTWSINKSVDKTLIRQVGGSAVFNYNVTVAETGFNDSDWVVTGKITVTNPNSWIDIPLTSLSDTVNNGGTCTVSGFTAGVTVLAGKSLTFDYTCAYTGIPDPFAGINSATATWDASIGAPHGSATNTANFTFDNDATGNPTNINKTVTVNDNYKGPLGTLTATTTLPYTAKTFNYSLSFSVTGSCKSYTNTATIKETGQMSSQTVTVCGPIKTGALTIGYWQNKNGQNIIKNAGAVSGVCKLTPWLRQFAPFQDLSSTASCTTVASYVTKIIKVANASGSSMNAMLKAQMLATALDVYFSDPALGGNKINAPVPIGGVTIDLTYICKVKDSSNGSGSCTGALENISAAFGGATSMKVMDMLTYAASKSNVGGSLWYGNVKSTQELAKDAFDAINNQAVFAP